MNRYSIFILFLVVCIAACTPKVKQKTGSKSSDVTTKGAEVPASYEDTKHFSEATELPTQNTTASVFAFGSCNKHNKPQPLWKSVMENNPDAWIWLGDAIYGDSDNEEYLRSLYKAQDAVADYQALKDKTSIIGTWDDHDYGKNNGGKSFKGKEKAKRAFLDFVKVSKDHPTRKRAGIYQAYTMGQGDKKVKIILLDNRTFRDDIKYTKKKVSIPDPQADLLGEAQWQWLAQELKNNDAAITIIANGTQVLHRFHRFEKWANHPTDRKRLFKMLGTYCPSGVVLLSGDRHHAEISKVNVKGLKHPLYDVTASGLTHSRKGLYPNPERNDFRVGKRVDDLNFGLIKINWDTNPIQVQLEIRGEDNALLESTVWEVKR